MIFYKIEAQITNMSEEEITEKSKDNAYTKLLQTKLTVFHEIVDNSCALFISSMRNKELIIGAIAENAVGNTRRKREK